MRVIPNFKVLTTIDDLERIVLAGARALAERHGIEPDVDDLRAAAAAAGAMILHMHEAALFANEASADLAALPTTDDARPEFGGAAPTPFGFTPPV